MQYALEEIIDIENLKNLLENFTRITGAVTAILNMDGEVLVATGWQDICTKFHRINPDTACRCLESDTYLASQLAAGEKYNVYKCKNGLVDVAAPIIIDGHHVGNVFTGQFLFSPPDKTFFINQAKKFGFDEDRYLSSLMRVPVFSQEQVEKTMHFLVGIAETIGAMGSIRLKNQKELFLRKKAEQKLREEVAEKKQGQKKLEQARNALELQVNCINKFQKNFIEGVPHNELFNNLLLDLLKLTQSQYGFVAEIRTEVKQSLHILAISNISWSEEAQKFYEDSALPEFRLEAMRGLYAAPWLERRVIISNTPHQDSRRCGFPQGHPPLNNYMGLPIWIGDQVEGVIGLANRPDGYDKELAHFLEPVVATCAQILRGVRNQKERDHTQIRLMRATKRFKSLAENSPMGVFQADPTGQSTYVNKRWTEISHRSREQTLGSGWSNAIHPQDREQTIASWQQAVSKSTAWQHECRILRPNGEVRWVTFHAFPEFDEHGSLSSFIGSVVDLTEQKQTELALEKSKQRLQIAGRTAYDLIYEWEVKTGSLTWFGDVDEILGFDPGEISHNITAWLALIHPDDAAVLENAVEHHAQSTEPIHYEYRIRKKDGTILYWEDNALPLFNDQGRPERWFGVCTDITKRKEAEKALILAHQEAESANRSKSEFLATMSHEIRTPLNAILGMTELLNDTSLTETQQWCVNTLNRSGEALLSIINDILDLSKIEAGQLSLEMRMFDLQKSVEKTIEILTLTALEKGIKLSHHIDIKDHNLVYGDSARLQQTLLNLIGNAIKFTSEGTVKLHIQTDQREQISFSVIDTGEGIHPDKQEEIFQPFTQSDSTITRRHGGTGLGLTICQRLVHLMGGKLQLVSELGKGSTFYFSLPLLKKAAQPTSHNHQSFAYHHKRSQKNSAGSEQRPLKILLVDDAEDNRLLVQAFIKNMPHQLVHAENGQEAVERFMAESFDLVFMDIQMPVMDGYEATRKIRSWEQENNATPTAIVALTAHALAEDSVQIKRAGCDLHLTKPVRKKRLLEVIHHFSL
ncbi:PocR ligand-binding domain-containing protein [Magnetococcales bacterium HHB-1]